MELKNILYIVIPCFNEEPTLRESARLLTGKLAALTVCGKISDKSKVVFVDDGSRDGTWDVITGLCREDKLFSGIALSRNCGHQYALLAGLLAVRGEADMVISMDADMQDDINAVDEMVDEYINGCDIVYGVRSKRDTDGFFKRFTAEGYYKLLGALGCDIVYNHADYRLMSACALEALSGYGEQRIFLRGIVPMLGFKTAIVKYERGDRFAGESKYSLKKMLALAFDGMMSLSLKPLRMIFGLGAFITIPAAVYLLYLIIALHLGNQPKDWRLAAASVWCVGGLIILSLGMVGEYVGRTYLETKHRPRFNIKETIGLEKTAGNDAND